MTEPPTAADILLVEDNPNDVELTLRALKKNNLINRVVVAKNGVEALDMIFGNESRGPVGLKAVLLDIKLPKVDGIEVLRRLKIDPRTKILPVVMLTSSREGSDLKACYDLGVNSYIVKPVEFDKFVEAMSHLGLYWLLLNVAPKL